MNLKELIFFYLLYANGNKLNPFLIFKGEPEKTNEKRFSEIKRKKKLFILFAKKKVDTTHQLL